MEEIPRMSIGTSLNVTNGNQGDVTSLLARWGKGDQSALEQLTPIIYAHLLRLARARLRQEYGECTLEPAALVHEAYLRLADQTKLQAGNRVHFFSVAANTTRRGRIEHARKRNAQKRGGNFRITLQTEMDIAEERAPDMVVLDEALKRLAKVD